MKNFKINKKKVASLFLAMSICLCTHNSFTEGEYTNTIRVTGNKVNVRLTPTTDTKENIIGRVNTGDTFTVISHEDGWYLISYNGQYAYISDKYGMEINASEIVNNANEICMAKITGNNVNIRSSASTSSNDNVIGFADITDNFKILGKDGDWYIIDYLGQTGYVYSKYVKETIVNEEDTKTIKMVYLTTSDYFYSDTNGTYMSILPEYQYAAVIKEENGYYKVRIDGVIGYINKNSTKKLTNTFIMQDLGRQIAKVYVNNKEVFRCHTICGRKSHPTRNGCYKIGHMEPNYQLTKKYKVKYWMQYNGHIGFHDAYWQEDKYYVEVARRAYEGFAKGRAKTYVDYHPSHGCSNLKVDDAAKIWDLISIGDNVIVVAPNNLIKDNIIGSLELNEILLVRGTQEEEQKVKKLV